MSIAGLIITVVRGPAGEAALAELAADPAVTLGPRRGERTAAVLEAPDAAADEAALQRLQAMPGVLRCDLVQVHHDDPAAEAGEVARRLSSRAGRRSQAPASAARPLPPAAGRRLRRREPVERGEDPPAPRLRRSPLGRGRNDADPDSESSL